MWDDEVDKWRRGCYDLEKRTNQNFYRNSKTHKYRDLSDPRSLSNENIFLTWNFKNSIK